MLGLAGAIVTMDAMGCQKDIAQIITEQEADKDWAGGVVSCSRGEGAKRREYSSLKPYGSPGALRRRSMGFAMCPCMQMPAGFAKTKGHRLSQCSALLP